MQHLATVNKIGMQFIMTAVKENDWPAIKSMIVKNKALILKEGLIVYIEEIDGIYIKLRVRGSALHFWTDIFAIKPVK